jgi:hypothetical protein
MKWQDLPHDVIVNVIELCDGHTIFKPEAFVELGVPVELVDRYAHVHESDMTSHKGTIFGGDGKPLPSLRGVYGLDVIESMNREFGCPGSDKFGRGSRARELSQQILDALEIRKK